MSNGTDVKLGIDETKEVLVAVNELGIFLLTILIDGLQVYKDVKAIIEKIKDDEEFRAKIQAAVDNIKAVRAEVGDLDASEGVILAGVQLSYVPKVLEALKSKPQSNDG